MKRIIKYTLILLFVAGFAAYLYFASSVEARDREGIVCNEVRITITDSALCAFITPKDIRRFVKSEYADVMGMQIDDIDNFEIERLLISKSAISGCESYTDRSGRLNIKVSQRKPVVRFDCNSGSWYADREGYIFPIEGSYTALLPVITGNVPVNFSNLEDGRLKEPKEQVWLSSILELTDYISSSSYWKQMFTQIDIRSSEVFLISAVGGLEIEFGGPGDIESKFYRIKRFYNTVYAGNEETYSSVSVKYRDQIVCKKRKKQ